MTDEHRCFGIWCEVWGGVTGDRVAWLKDHTGRDPRFFPTFAEAEAEAHRLNLNRSPYGAAHLRYSARKYV